MIGITWPYLSSAQGVIALSISACIKEGLIKFIGKMVALTKRNLGQ